jgi:hypothetical protein
LKNVGACHDNHTGLLCSTLLLHKLHDLFIAHPVVTARNKEIHVFSVANGPESLLKFVQYTIRFLMCQNLRKWAEKAFASST